MIAIAAASAVAVGGGGAAIAAVTKDDARKSEDAVLADAAKRLNVTPGKLRDALKAAQDAQLDKRLDEAVKSGDLTRKQADEIKQAHEQSGSVLGFGPRGGKGMHRRGFKPGGPPPGGPGRHFPGRRAAGIGLFGDLAKALGVTERELMTRVRKGDSIAKVAKAEGKSLASVRSAVKAAAKTRADKAVKAGDLTRKQADKILEHVDERLQHLDRAPRLRLRRGGHPPIAPEPGNRPGSFAPAPPDPALPPETIIH